MTKKKEKGKLFSATNIMNKMFRAVKSDLMSAELQYSVDPVPLELFRNRQIDEFFKEFEDPQVKQEAQHRKAIESFFEINLHMKDVATTSRLPFDIKVRHIKRLDERTLVLTRARALCHEILTDITEDEWFSNCNHTSGSSVGVPYKDTAFDAKMKLPISITKEAVPYFQRYIEWSGQLGHYIQSDFSRKDKLHLNRDIFKIVRGSHSFTVPKNQDKRRFAAKEPTGNVFLQKGTEACLISRLRNAGLDLSTLQASHKEIAYGSSISTLTATIDFADASNCISNVLVRYLVPPVWYKLLRDIKSREIKIDDEWHTMHMFSNMGNATTFPIETLIFYCLATAAYDVHTRPYSRSFLCESESKSVCSVFGDDTILPSVAFPLFEKIVTSVGLIVNKDKSHHKIKDRFRESCGADFLYGRSVRPFRTGGPRSCSVDSLESWLYICMNGLLKKYIAYFGDLSYLYEKKIFKLFKNIFREHHFKLKVVPRYFPDDSGLRYFDDIERFLYWNRFTLSETFHDDHGLAYFRFLRYRPFQGAWNKRLSDQAYRYFHSLTRLDHYKTWIENPDFQIVKVDKGYIFFHINLANNLLL